MPVELVDAADRWVVPMAGLPVTQCRLDYAFTIIIGDEPGASFQVCVEQPFMARMAGRGDELLLDPEGDPAEMAPALGVLHRRVEQAIAFKDGRLELLLGDGSVLEVPAGEDYEPWNIVGPSGLRIVSLPGGGLAIWSPEPDQPGSG